MSSHIFGEHHRAFGLDGSGGAEEDEEYPKWSGDSSSSSNHWALIDDQGYFVFHEHHTDHHRVPRGPPASAQWNTSKGGADPWSEIGFSVSDVRHEPPG